MVQSAQIFHLRVAEKENNGFVLKCRENQHLQLFECCSAISDKIPINYSGHQTGSPKNNL